MKCEKAVIVMGLTVNGLGVLRSLGRLGVDCYGIYSDAREEMGIYSKYLLDVKKINDVLSYDELFMILRRMYHEIRSKPILIPTADEYAYFIAKYQDELKKDFIIRCPTNELHEIFLDKGKTFELCKKNRIKMPRTETPTTSDQLYENAKDFKYPTIVKPRKTFGISFPGKNFIAPDEDTLLSFFNQHPHLIGQTIIQEIIKSGDGNIFVAAAYSGSNLKATEVYTGINIRQYLPDYGVTCFGQSKNNLYLSNLTRQFLDRIGYCGFAALEFAYLKDSHEYFFIELNTRTYYHNQLFADAGVDLSQIAYYEMCGLDYKTFLSPIAQRDNFFWLDFKRDIGSFYRKWTVKEISFWEWFKSLWSARYFAYFNLHDLKPFMKSSVDLLSICFQFIFKRDKC